jgi:hypothetical protein
MVELKQKTGFRGPMAELCKIASEAWDKLDPEDKKKYRKDRSCKLDLLNAMRE